MTEHPGEWLRRQADTRPKTPALIASGSVTRYATLDKQVRQLAAYYLESGLEPGQPLALISRSRESIIRLSGLAFYLDCPILPLAPDQNEIETLLADAGILQVLADNTATLPGAVRRFDIHFPMAQTSAIPDSLPALPSNPRFQLLIATSGTTGTPKVAALSTRSITASVMCSRERLGLESDDIWLNCLPVTNVGGFMIFLRCLQSGATMHLFEGFNPEQIQGAILENQCTHISLVPAMLARLLDKGIEIPAGNRLRVALTGGGPLNEQLLKRALDHGWPVCTSYGMTETASHICLNTEIADDGIHTDAGLPVTGAEIDIVPGEGNLSNRDGQIRIAGPMVMSGYMRNGKLDTHAVENGFLSDDLGYLDNKGHLHVTGRADDMLVSGGTNVHPAEVERLIRQCPGIREIGVTAIPDSIWGDRLVACVAADSSLQEIEHWCREHLPGHLRPRTFRRVETLPRNAMGKLDRSLLQQHVLDNASQSSN